MKLYVVGNGGPALLGRDWLSSLGIHKLNLNNVVVSTSVKSVEDIFSEYKDVFSEKLGTYNKGKVSLQLKPDSQPVFFKPRPVPFSLVKKVEDEIDRLVSNGILEPVETNSWGTPIVSIPKSDSSIRLCGDYSVTLNPCLIVDQYPLPKISNLLNKLSGGQVFSKIDLKQAYQQVLLDDESKKLTTISTSKGLFMYSRIPFGITSGPSIFQRIADQLVMGIEGTVAFQDDILISGKNETEHLENLRKVLSRLKDSGLTVCKEKCNFFQSSIKYLGYIIDSKGLHTDPDKISAIVSAPAPTNVSELKAFLGIVNFYGSFVQNLASILHPLYQLLRKNVDWHWSKQCNDSFNKVKELMTSVDFLAHYDPSLPLKLSCDASSYGLGCVLSTVLQSGEERPIAFASRVLSKAEKGYSQTDKEALSIVYGVKKFNQYLFGRNFILVTDHKPLLSIFGKKKGIPQIAANRLQRWAYFLSAYDYSISFVKSADHGNADGLSRLPVDVSNNDNIDDYDFLKFIQEGCVPLSSKNVELETKKDKTLSLVLQYVMFGWPSDIDSSLKLYFYRREELNVESNCIMWGYRVVIPSSLRHSLLIELHKNHLGIVKMKSIARSCMWWPGIDKDIEQIANSCEHCNNNRSNPPKTVLHSWNIPDKPWVRVHADFFGPINNKMYLLVIDAYSKFIEVMSMNNITSSATISQLRKLFARYGLPLVFVTDNGRQWTSDEFTNFMSMNGIKHSLTAPYHPATNGAAENAVKSLKKCCKIAKESNVDVETAIDRFLFDYRNSQHCTTCESPSKLMFGRRLRTRFDLLRPCKNENWQRNVENQGKYFQGNRTVSFNVGELVLVRDYRSSHKWSKARIVKTLSPVSFEVRILDCDTICKRHADQILPLNIHDETSVFLGDTTAKLVESDTSDLNEYSCVGVPSPKSLPVTSTPLMRSQRNSVSPIVNDQDQGRPNLTAGSSSKTSPECVNKGEILDRRYPLRERVKRKIFDL